MQAKYIPNLITGFRLGCTPVLAYWIVVGDFRAAFYLLLLMGVSDAADGFLAKRFDWRTRLGEFFDPLADKLMLVTAFITLAWTGLLPLWLMVLVLARDAVIVSGGLAYHCFIHRFRAQPSFVSKTNTLFQLVLVCVVVYAQFGTLPDFALPLLMTVVTLTTIWSGLTYVVNWSIRARNEARRVADSAR